MGSPVTSIFDGVWHPAMPWMGKGGYLQELVRAKQFEDSMAVEGSGRILFLDMPPLLTRLKIMGRRLTARIKGPIQGV